MPGVGLSVRIVFFFFTPGNARPRCDVASVPSAAPQLEQLRAAAARLPVYSGKPPAGETHPFLAR
eukprot:1215-Prymnesium_polylepis.1